MPEPARCRWPRHRARGLHEARRIPCKPGHRGSASKPSGTAIPAGIGCNRNWPLAFITAGAAPAPGTRRAVWTEHDLTIDLEHLSRSYSCSDLRYKIHDVLQAIGARPSIRIDVSRCGADLDTHLDAPRAHLIFSLPIEVSGNLADFYETFVVERTVRIEPAILLLSIFPTAGFCGSFSSHCLSRCRYLRRLTTWIVGRRCQSTCPSVSPSRRS